MKSLKRIKTLALIAFISTPALAENIDVRVTGTLTPNACTPTLSGGGIFDYGKIPASSLSQDDYTYLDEKTLDFAISCIAPTKLAVTLTNGRSGSEATDIGEGYVLPSGFAFGPVEFIKYGPIVAGLGKAGNANIGGYALAFQNHEVYADGKQLSLMEDSMNGQGWKGLFPWLMMDYPNKISWYDKSEGVTPIAITNLSAKLATQAYINKASELDLTQPILLDGLSTFELIYL